MGDELTDLSEDLRYRNVMAVKEKKAGKRKIELQMWSIAREVCGEWFNTISAKAIYCSDACRMKAYRERRK